MANINGTPSDDFSLYGTDFDDFMQGFGGSDHLFGFAGNDIIYGGDGNDLINGGSGADIMQGGTGDDGYFSPDDAGDVVIEAPGEGIDRITSYISYVLPANVEDLSLAGANAINGTGNGLDNFLTGNSGNNILKGLAGNDFINGGSGADTMKGGAGDDTYFSPDDAGDVVIEAPGEGIDRITSYISYVLPANVEDMYLGGANAINGTGNGLDNILVGNASNNILEGGAGNDILNGLDGADIMKGGAGNDFMDGDVGTDTMQGGAGDDGYTVDNVSDVVTETFGQGIDFVVSSISYVLGANVERLALTGADAINGTGNGLDNYLRGNTGNNILKGGTGNDIIDGGMGLDKLSGGTGADRFIFNAILDSPIGANRDVITDFSHVQLDLIYVSHIDSDDGVTGDQAFTFIGNAAFSAAGQLRYDALKGILQGNVNNTLTPDFEIKLSGAPIVDATDFVL